MSPELDTLAFRFFKIFAQYESALKSMGFASMTGNRVRIDWELFANQIGNPLMTNDSPDVKAAREYILGSPPRSQTVTADGLGWRDDRRPTNSVGTLFVYITRVRNNLFHGGKFSDESDEDDERNRKLLSSSLLLLETLVAGYGSLSKMKEQKARTNVGAATDARL